MFNTAAISLSFGAESLSSRLLLKNLKIKIYRTIILSVVFMGVKLGRRHCGRKGS